MNVNKSWWTPLFGKANILPKSARHAFIAAGFEIAGWEILNKRRNILTTKKFKKVSIILVTLLAVLLSLLSLVGCGVSKKTIEGTYSNNDEKGYLTITLTGNNSGTVYLYNVWVVATDTTTNKEVEFAWLKVNGTFTYSTTENSDHSYDVTLSVYEYEVKAKFYPEGAPNTGAEEGENKIPEIHYYRWGPDPIIYKKGDPDFDV